MANIGWLLGGKGFAAVCSIIYLAILTRTLGLKGFGHFSLIAGTAQILCAIAGFQTWRVVVRYGVRSIHDKDWGKFGRLIGLCAIMDVGGAIFGCIVAGVIIYGFSKSLSLNPAYIDMAFFYSCAALWALKSTMAGVLRSLDRFDIMAYIESVPSVLRLVTALGIWWAGASVGHFLTAWAIIMIIEAVSYWTMAYRLVPQAFSLSYIRDWRLAIREHGGIRHFLWITYCGSTLDAAMKQGPLLLVGAFVGTSSAGLYRLANQLAQSLNQLSTIVTRTVYPEVARAHATAGFQDFRKLALRISTLAGGAGLFVVTIALVLGGQVLALIGGEDFEKGAVILVPLAIAGSCNLASVAFEPVLHATGKASLALIARAMAVIALGLGTALFVSIGPSGVAWALALGAAVSYTTMGLSAWYTLQKLGRSYSPA